jgi:hypothetical protein
MKAIKNILKYPFYLFMYFVSLFYFLFTKKTPHSGYAALRIFFIATKGRSNRFLNKFIGAFVGKYKNIKSKGILGDLTNKDIHNITSQIQKDGFCVFDVKLDEGQLNQIISFSKSTPTRYIDISLDVPSYKEELVLLNEDNIISPRYQFNKSDLVTNETIMNLATDKSILAVAQSYLGCKPVLDKISMWWSFPFNKKGASAAAQMYHFDMDRIKFLKFFFYITDVHNENGPHCYIRGSHKSKPLTTGKEGRRTDEEITQAFKEEDILEICGKKGSILAVDTSGLHKGKPLTKDKRLLLQLEFANTLYGTSYEVVTLPKDISKEVKETINEYKYTYNQVLKY